MLLVRNRMRELGITQTQVGAHLRITQTAVSKLLAGKRQLKASEAQALAELLNLNELGFPLINRIPVIGLISAGDWQNAIEQPLTTIPAPDPRLGPNVFGVIVEGDSMNLLVQDGATIIIDPNDLDLVGRGIYAVMNSYGETTVKKFMADPARLEPCSDNPAHQTIYPGREVFTVVGRVIWKAESLR